MSYRGMLYRLRGGGCTSFTDPRGPLGRSKCGGGVNGY